MYGFFLSQATFPWNSEVVSWELKQTRNASYHWKRCVRCSSNVGRRTGKRGERWQTTPNESVVYWQRANECPFVLLLFCMENNQQPFREIWTQADARTQTETCHVFRVRHGRVIMMAVHNLSLSVCVPVCVYACFTPPECSFSSPSVAISIDAVSIEWFPTGRKNSAGATDADQSASTPSVNLIMFCKLLLLFPRSRWHLLDNIALNRWWIRNFLMRSAGMRQYCTAR